MSQQKTDEQKAREAATYKHTKMYLRPNDEAYYADEQDPIWNEEDTTPSDWTCKTCKVMTVEVNGVHTCPRCKEIIL